MADEGGEPGRGGTNLGWLLMVLVLLLEVAGGIVLCVRMVAQALNERDVIAESEFAVEANMMTVGIIIVVVLGTVWVGMTLIAALRRRNWARGSNVTIQVLVFAGATGVLQGIMGEPRVGIVLLVLAVIGIIATLLTRPRRDPLVNAT